MMNPLYCHTQLPEEISTLNDSLATLTPRQRDVVELWAYGCTQTEIAAELQIRQQSVSELFGKAVAKLKNL